MLNTIQLTPQQKDEYLNKLLIFMKNEIEKLGASNYKQVTFNFEETKTKNIGEEVEQNKNGEDRNSFIEQAQITNEIFNVILNFALAHKFIATLYRGFGQIYITEDGMDRAMSVERASFKPAVGDSTNITFNGPVTATNLQAGNNNTQNINNVFYYLIDEIKKSDASEEEKKNALKKLKEFISNPVISGITSGCAVEILKFLAGMGI